MSLSARHLERHLQALSDELEGRGARARIVVVGGAALILQGIVSRQTGDVDVLAEVHDGALLLPRPFSDALGQAIERVAAAFPDQLSADWMNAVVARAWAERWPNGLPPGLDAVTWHDLLALAPSDDELEAAAAWVRAQDGSNLSALLTAVIDHVRTQR